MKRLNIFKTVQLFVFIAITVFCLYKVISDPDIYYFVAINPDIRLICGFLWAVLGISFLCMFFDFSLFSSYKKELRELSRVVHSDHLAGIPNRYSCDSVIEKYFDKPLPCTLGCIMFDITNIREINSLYGHSEGNKAIKSFSNILRIASIDLCFVGRNGGNKFMALFEDGSDEKLNLFLDRVAQKVEEHNLDNKICSVEYLCGSAFNEPAGTVSSVTELIALANSRIYNNKTASDSSSETNKINSSEDV